jgi:hypothetical protein
MSKTRKRKLIVCLQLIGLHIDRGSFIDPRYKRNWKKSALVLEYDQSSQSIINLFGMAA